MKYLIQILFICVILGFGSGIYIKNLVNDHIGDQVLGVTVLFTVFILFPLFIYHRSKGKKMSDYMFTKENIDKMTNKDKKYPDNQ